MNSRAKGQRGEREWAAWLRDNLGCTEARRGQQHRGGPDSPDVLGGIAGTHCEVKLVEKLSLYAAMDQAVREAGENAVPYVAHRRNRKPWLVIVQAHDLLAFVRAVATRQNVERLTEDELMEATQGRTR